MINRVCKSNWTWRIPREETFGGPFYEAKIVFSIDNIIKIITHCQPKFWRLKKINFVSCDQHFLFLEKAVSNDHLCDHGKSEISSELSLLSFWISWFYHGGFFFFQNVEDTLLWFSCLPYHIKKPKFFPSDALEKVMLLFFSPFLPLFYLA